jgi:hypothetical protein
MVRYCVPVGECFCYLRVIESIKKAHHEVVDHFRANIFEMLHCSFAFNFAAIEDLRLLVSVEEFV